MNIIIQAVVTGLFWLVILSFFVATVIMSAERRGIYFSTKLSGILYIIILVFSITMGVLVYLNAGIEIITHSMK